MPIIFWGSRGITSTLENGEFHCPRCGSQEEYRLRRVRPWFTLYFIPLFPIGGGRRYVECERCGQAYHEEVLEQGSPDDTRRLLDWARAKLLDGWSMDEVCRRLVKEGINSRDAVDFLKDLCEGRPKECRCGLRYHPSAKRCAECGDEL